MSDYLLDVIRKYGFESKRTIYFARLMESKAPDKVVEWVASRLLK